MSSPARWPIPSISAKRRPIFACVVGNGGARSCCPEFFPILSPARLPRRAARGLGAYIAENTAAGNYPKIVLGIAVMSLLVTLFNRLLWRPLYAYAEERLRLD